jgi:hypothetical protein
LEKNASRGLSAAGKEIIKIHIDALANKKLHGLKQVKKSIWFPEKNTEQGSGGNA